MSFLVTFSSDVIRSNGHKLKFWKSLRKGPLSQSFDVPTRLPPHINFKECVHSKKLGVKLTNITNLGTEEVKSLSELIEYMRT